MRLFVRVLAIAIAFITSVSADCSREGLLDAADSYIQAQSNARPNDLYLASNFQYQENNNSQDIKRGVMSRALRIEYARTIADTVACASYTIIISPSGSNPYVISTQIRHNNDDTSEIALIDTIAATNGAMNFNAGQTLDALQKEGWRTTLDPFDRSNRETLKYVADAYLDMWTDSKAADKISWAADCERIQGSRVYKPCNTGLPTGGSSQSNSNRRYVIDEEVGSINVLDRFGGLGGVADSHEFRLERGQIKYVHTVTLQ